MGKYLTAFWNVPASDLIQEVQSTPNGLTGDKAREHLMRFGFNLLKPKRRTDALTLLVCFSLFYMLQPINSEPAGLWSPSSQL
ncbi:MAG: hypothetical protein C4291_11185 [Candidatus Dadabacteria bacterium]